MKYDNIVKAKFLNRPNRFVANVWLNGKQEMVHVKNTGRCHELLLPDTPVILQRSDNASRKTKYDLITVYKENLGWINIDSQAPNKVVKEWLMKQDYSLIRPEYTYGNSRLDFYMEKGGKKYMMEVKGFTLEIGGIGYFPDAPTKRGVRHLEELSKATAEGFLCTAAFVIQMEGVHEVRANTATHREFGDALERAKTAGVKIICMECRVSEDTLEVVKETIL